MIAEAATTSPGSVVARQVSGDGLVAVLGWCVDDFTASVRETGAPALHRALEVLAPDDVSDPEWVRRRSWWAFWYIVAELRRRGEK